MIQGSPGLEIDIVSRIELGYSYELGSGWTRIGVLTRPRKRLGMVMTASQLGTLLGVAGVLANCPVLSSAVFC